MANDDIQPRQRIGAAKPPIKPARLPAPAPLPKAAPLAPGGGGRDINLGPLLKFSNKKY